MTSMSKLRQGVSWRERTVIVSYHKREEAATILFSQQKKLFEYL